MLSSFAFAGIRNVSNLMLGHNQLNVIEDSAFAATEMIEMLILNNNPIKVCSKPNFGFTKFLKLPRFAILVQKFIKIKSQSLSNVNVLKWQILSP